MPPQHPTQCEAFVAEHREVSPHIHWLVLAVEGEVAKPEPGQFVFLRVTDALDPFLRRPMSVFGFRESGSQSEIEILYRVVGRGTAVLARRRKGERVDLIGPLDRGFRLGDGPRRVLVAGGMGAAPLVYLAAHLPPEDELVLGCRSGAEFPVPFLEARVSRPVRVSTEDGSLGRRGLASELASDLAAEHGWAVQFMAAGPAGMLAALARLARDRKVGCQVCLEARMACGVGSCLGCVVPASGPEPYRRVCTEGPVFDAGEIRWEVLS